MNKRIILMGVAIAAVAIAAVVFYPKFFAGNQDTHEHSNIEYYTCPMHPSVKSKDPGKCPICGMDLTPVYKKGAGADSILQDLTFGVSPAKRQLIGVKMAEVAVRPMQKVIRAVGRVDYDERKVAVVNLKVAGWIKDLYVDYTGQRVRKGQPLFSIYSPDLVSTQEEYLQAMKAMKQQEAVSAGMQTISRSGHGDVLLNSGEALLRTARQRLLLWDITPEQITELEKRGAPETHLAIKAPIDGHVIEKKAVAGMYVMPEMELYKISDLSNLWIYADVYEYELPYVQVGQEAQINLSYYPGEPFTGRVTYVYPYLNAETRTARVRLEAPNHDSKLKPEMFADVQITVDLGEKLTVPESAIMNTGTRQIAFVDKGDGMFEARLVQTGAKAHENYEILDGLHAGEQVVASANFLVDSESKLQGVLQKLEGNSAPAAATTQQH